MGLGFLNMSMVKSSYSADGRFHLTIDRTLAEVVEGNIFEEVRSCIKEAIAQHDIKQRIIDEVSRQLLSMESKSELAKLIAEIVSETIKETITQ